GRRERFSRDAFYGLFAGGIDVEHRKRVGVFESDREIVHKFLRTRVAMRLEDHMYFAEATLLGGGQSCFDLGGMMAVVVDHAYAGNFAAQLEATIHSVEILQCLANVLQLEIEPDADSDRGRRIQDVVDSGNA